MARARTSARRAGFTLPELMVALVVSGLVLLGARATVEAVQGLSARSAEAARASDRLRNGERMLRGLVQGITTGEDEASHFAGEQASARFLSRCDAPAGWTEPCAVRLAVERRDSLLVLVARVGSATPVVLLRANERLELGYLHDASEGGQWFRSWGSSIVAPIAIGIQRDEELLILPVGARG